MAARRSKIDLALGLAASVLLMSMMLMTFADVISRYLFNWPLRGAFELTELALLVLIFAGLPLVSRADEHVTMDFVDRILSPALQTLVRRAVHIFCGLVLLALAWQVGVKAGKIAAYGDTTDVLKITVGPFVYFMAVMVAVTGIIHLITAFQPIELSTPDSFDPERSGTT